MNRRNNSSHYHGPGRRTMLRRFFLKTVPVIIVAGILCCKGPQLRSAWTPDGIVIDGKSDEWQGRLLQSENRAAATGIMNDSAMLYLCIVSHDEELNRQLQRRGFSVTFRHAELGKYKRGIRFIADTRHHDFTERPDRNFDTGSEVPMHLHEGLAFRMIEIMGPQPEQVRICAATVAEKMGIRSMVTTSRYDLVFELAVPLHPSENDDFSLGFEQDSVMEMVLETTSPARNRMQRPGGGGPGGGRPGGGRPGGGGPGGGRPGGGRPGGGMSLPEPIKMKVQVVLAKAP